MRKFFEFQNEAKINCGESALLTIGKELKYLGAAKPLLLTSSNAEKLMPDSKTSEPPMCLSAEKKLCPDKLY